MAGKRRRDEAGDEEEGFSLIGAVDASEIGIKRQRLRVHDRRRGHMFKHTVARDQSKVQYGDQIYHISGEPFFMCGIAVPAKISNHCQVITTWDPDRSKPPQPRIVQVQVS